MSASKPKSNKMKITVMEPISLLHYFHLICMYSAFLTEFPFKVCMNKIQSYVHFALNFYVQLAYYYQEESKILIV